MHLKYLINTIICLISLSGCSTIECTKFGVFEYCHPKFTKTSKEFQKEFESRKTQQEKNLKDFIESTELQTKWLKTIQDVTSYLTSKNSPLHGDIIPSGEGLNGKYDYSIKIIHEDNSVEIKVDDKIKKEIYTQAIIFTKVTGEDNVKKNPNLLFKAVPLLKLLLQLETSKDVIANEFNTILQSKYQSKLLAEYYVHYPHKAYITKSNISPHVDLKGNIYLPEYIINNKNMLKLVMLHEAFHLLPVGMNNQYIAKSFFGAFSSEKFATDNAKSVLNTPLSYNVNSLKKDDTIVLNPALFEPRVSNILSSMLNVELFIDAKVLSYISDDETLCLEYYNLLKSVKLDTSKDRFQRERLPIIQDTCLYMKKNTFSLQIQSLRKSQQDINKVFLKQLNNIMDILSNETNPKTIVSKISLLISKEILNKQYNGDTKKIMLKWYSKIMESMLMPVFKKMMTPTIEIDSNMQEAIINTIKKD